MATVTVTYPDDCVDRVAASGGYDSVYAVGTPDEVPAEERLAKEEFNKNLVLGQIRAFVNNYESGQMIDREEGYQPVQFSGSLEA